MQRSDLSRIGATTSLYSAQNERWVTGSGCELSQSATFAGSSEPTASWADFSSAFESGGVFGQKLTGFFRIWSFIAAATEPAREV